MGTKKISTHDVQHLVSWKAFFQLIGGREIDRSWKYWDWTHIPTWGGPFLSGVPYTNLRRSFSIRRTIYQPEEVLFYLAYHIPTWGGLFLSSVPYTNLMRSFLYSVPYTNLRRSFSIWCTIYQPEEFLFYIVYHIQTWGGPFLSGVPYTNLRRSFSI